MTLDELLHEYDKTHHRYESCRQSTERLIQTILDKAGIRVHKVECRVKHRESLKRKIELKRDKYEQLSQITDLVAFRIITFFEDEVDKVAEIIRNEFDIDEDNSVDKRLKNSEKFGYQSLHYVFTYKKGRTDFLEYEQFKELKCEIQIRSILQHAWAEIEHDIGYKSEVGIPLPVKRNFLRTAALLETADLEFMRLRDSLSEYELEVGEKIKSSPDTVLIDKASLEAYLKQSEIVITLDNEIAKHYQSRLFYFSDTIDVLIRYTSLINITTIEELSIELKSNKDQILRYAKAFVRDNGYHSEKFGQWGSILFLIMYISARNGNRDLIYQMAREGHKDENIAIDFADKAVELYAEISKN